MRRSPNRRPCACRSLCRSLALYPTPLQGRGRRLTRWHTRRLDQRVSGDPQPLPPFPFPNLYRPHVRQKQVGSPPHLCPRNVPHPCRHHLTYVQVPRLTASLSFLAISCRCSLGCPVRCAAPPRLIVEEARQAPTMASTRRISQPKSTANSPRRPIALRSAVRRRRPMGFTSGLAR